MNRMIKCLIAVSLIAILCPGASAQEKCYWTTGKDPKNPSRWCYWCQTGYKNVNGKWVETGYCVTYWGGSNYNSVMVQYPDGYRCNPDDANGISDCGFVLSGIFGREELRGPCNPDRLDPDCAINVLGACCPPEYTSPQRCTPAADTEEKGWRTAIEGVQVGTGSLFDVRKEYAHVLVSLDFEDDVCTNQNMEGVFVAYRFNGLTCVFPNGFAYNPATGRIEACAEWNKERNRCLTYGYYVEVNEQGKEIRHKLPSTTALFCEAPKEIVEKWQPGDTIVFGSPEGKNSEQDQGTCQNLALEGGEEFCMELLNRYLIRTATESKRIAPRKWNQPIKKKYEFLHGPKTESQSSAESR